MGDNIMKKLYFLLTLTIIVISLCGCGKSNQKNSNFKETTFVDGITISIPEEWSEYEVEAEDNIPGTVGTCYFFSGSPEKNKNSINGYKMDDVDEAFMIAYCVLDRYKGKSAKDVYKDFKELIETDETAKETTSETKIDGVDCFVTEVDGTKSYAVPLDSGKILYVIWVKKDDAITRHTAEIEEVINSISIDKSLK